MFFEHFPRWLISYYRQPLFALIQDPY